MTELLSRVRAWCRVLAVVSCSLAGACSDRVKIGQDLPLANTGDNGGRGGGSSAGAPSREDAAGAPAECRITACQGKVYDCGNCVDDDRDGLADAADSQCTGPCDDTEDSYFGGIPGQNNAPCHSDCYFDQDTGPGNDQCYWSQSCDPLSVASDYPPSGDSHCAYDPDTHIPATSASCAELRATQSASCAAYCGPLTPNGCDSFGCCELPAGSSHFVWLGSTDGNQGSCNEKTLDDPAACHPCTPVPSTFKPCAPCQVCVGRPAAVADAICPNATDRCPRGERACGQAGELACDVDEYCVTGCCEPAPK